MPSAEELNPSSNLQEEDEKNDHPSHLSPSELGTKEYWESFYERSLSHLSSKNRKGGGPARGEDEGEENEEDSDSDFDEDSDPGTSWFKEHQAPEKVLRFLTDEKIFPLAPVHGSRRQRQQQQHQQHATILDLGTGNGSMLALLRDKGGFKGRMVGVDYSVKSVELARRLWGDSHGKSAGAGAGGDEDEGVTFEEWDILGVSREDFEGGDRDGGGGAKRNGMPGWFRDGGFDIVLDKGTFDAVSLSEEVVEEEKEEDGDGTRKGGRAIQRRVCERYPGIARRLVKKGGFLVVTSCNWTEEELVRWFTGRYAEDEDDERDRLIVWDRVEYPRFKFGGQEGQGVCTVCFTREG